jgi:hypothetical protein
MTPARNFFLIAIFLMLTQSVQAASVKLPRALGSNADSRLSGKIIVAEEIFAPAFSQSLNILANVPPLPNAWVPSEMDQATILEAGISKLTRDSNGKRKTSPDLLKKTVSSQSRNTTFTALGGIWRLMKASLHFGAEAIKGNLISGSPYPAFNADAVRSVAENIEVVPFYLTLAYQLEEKAAVDSAFAQARDAAYALVRSELAWLDYQIKIVRNTDSELADRLATSIVVSMMAGEHPLKETVLAKTFDGLEGQFRLTKDANRYITRTIDWAVVNWGPKIRVWSFQVAVVTGMLSAMTGFSTFDLPSAILSETARNSFLVGLNSYAIYLWWKIPLRRVTLLLDRGLNMISRSMDRSGDLSKAIAIRRQLVPGPGACRIVAGG